MRRLLAAGACILFFLAGCTNQRAGSGQETEEINSASEVGTVGPFNRNTKIEEVRNDPAFGSYGRLIFPADEGYWSGETLEELHLTWYNNIDPDKTVEIVNTLWQRAAEGETVFYDIYTDEEKEADPDKRDTGLFFFKGNPGEKFAVCNAGGGFAYVGAMQDSFPHALELSKKGYNAFVLIYRPGAQTACEDLARALSFIFSHAEELEVDTDCYSLWGGSAGARMAAWLGSYGLDRRPLAGIICPSRERSSCSIPATATTQPMIPPPLPAWVRVTASPTGAPCSGAFRP